MEQMLDVEVLQSLTFMIGKLMSTVKYKTTLISNKWFQNFNKFQQILTAGMIYCSVETTKIYSMVYTLKFGLRQKLVLKISKEKYYGSIFQTMGNYWVSFWEKWTTVKYVIFQHFSRNVAQNLSWIKNYLTPSWFNCFQKLICFRFLVY